MASFFDLIRIDGIFPEEGSLGSKIDAVGWGDLPTCDSLRNSRFEDVDLTATKEHGHLDCRPSTVAPSALTHREQNRWQTYLEGDPWEDCDDIASSDFVDWCKTFMQLQAARHGSSKKSRDYEDQDVVASSATWGEAYTSRSYHGRPSAAHAEPYTSRSHHGGTGWSAVPAPLYTARSYHGVGCLSADHGVPYTSRSHHGAIGSTASPAGPYCGCDTGVPDPSAAPAEPYTSRSHHGAIGSSASLAEPYTSRSHYDAMGPSAAHAEPLTSRSHHGALGTSTFLAEPYTSRSYHGVACSSAAPAEPFTSRSHTGICGSAACLAEPCTSRSACDCSGSTPAWLTPRTKMRAAVLRPGSLRLSMGPLEPAAGTVSGRLRLPLERLSNDRLVNASNGRGGDRLRSALGGCGTAGTTSADCASSASKTGRHFLEGCLVPARSQFPGVTL